MKVAVLMGGRSGEYAVSLRSGNEVLKALAALGLEGIPLVFEKDGSVRFQEKSLSMGEGLWALSQAEVDFAFIAMHGKDGEDGKVQAVLELLDIPYQGSGVLASAIGMHKVRAKDMFRAKGLPVAEDLSFQIKAFPELREDIAALGFPLVLKTMASGSSVGVSRVETEEELLALVPQMGEAEDELLAERLLTGREFTAPVLEFQDGRLEALPIVEIVPPGNEFFDYEAKYTPGLSQEIVPAAIPEALEMQLRELGKAAHRAIGARGYSRSDLMLNEKGEPFLLETNTLPGLTAESLLPLSASTKGMDFSTLILFLLREGLAFHGKSSEGLEKFVALDDGA